ncbi:MAG: hypothetical protein JJU05_00375 [Verrucomicrobia bacterium]|nr:hypothetical protein [Verrucomicrobiota bacterium]MCH8526282.1 hypothetical protein [Kiritimatiellia bacterium]
MKNLTVLFGLWMCGLVMGESRWPVDARGEPFFVKGVTFTIKNTPENPRAMESALRDVKEMGGNTIRTWGVGSETRALLDAAHAEGIKVMLGLWLEHGRDGAEGDGDMNYLLHTDRTRRQTGQILRQVAEFHEHPALLGWGVGNEVILNIPTEEQKIAYARYLEALCQEIRKIDPVNPLMSVSAFTVSVPYWEKYCPSLDVYGINAYGPAIGAIPAVLRELGSQKPYVVTEFGPQGTWDAAKDARGVPVTPTDREKYDQIVRGWAEWVEAKRPEGCLGAFSFNFGDDWGPTSFHLDFFVRGHRRPGYWATREAFSGRKPEGLDLNVGGLLMSPVEPAPGEWVRAGVEPLNGPSLGERVSFYYRTPLEARDIRNRVLPLEHEALRDRIYRFQPPRSPGVYEIYMHRLDEAGNLTIAQSTLRVVE